MLSSQGSVEEQTTPLFFKAAVSHLELAVANICAQSYSLKGSEGSAIHVAIAHLHNLLEKSQQESSQRSLPTGETVSCSSATPGAQNTSALIGARGAGAQNTSASGDDTSGQAVQRVTADEDLEPSRHHPGDDTTSFAQKGSRRSHGTDVDLQASFAQKGSRRSHGTDVDLQLARRSSSSSFVQPPARDPSKSGDSKSKSSVSANQNQDWMKHLMDVFDQLDGDKTGVIELNEWVNAFEAAGLPSDKAEEYFKAFAKNDGVMDRVEWMHVIVHVQHGRCPQMIADCMNALAEMQAQKGRIFFKSKPQGHLFLLRPDSGARILWDLTIVGLLVYIAIVMPLIFGFDLEDAAQNAVAVTDRVIDVLFLIDVLINFRTGYVEKDVLVLDPWRIARHYLKTWFLVDFLTSIPIAEITSGLLPDLQVVKLLKIGKIWKVFKLLRFGRLRSVAQNSEFFAWFEDHLTDSFSRAMMRVFVLFVQLMLLCHWMACLAPMSGSRWLTYSEGSAKLGYSAAMYWAMMTLTTVGYGDVIPGGDSERFYAIGSMTVGGCFYGFMIGKISSTIAARDLNAVAYNERMQLIESWLHYHSEFPLTLRRRIKRFFQAHLLQKSAVDDTAILKDLSPALFHDASFFLVQEEVRCNRLFHNLPDGALQHILPILEKTECNADEPIVLAGDIGNGMYIVEDGVARYEDEDWNLFNSGDSGPADVSEPLSSKSSLSSGSREVITRGGSFGEEIILEIEEEYHYTIIAKTAMSMFFISKDGFLEKFKGLPDIVHRMHENFLGHPHTDDNNPRKRKPGRGSTTGTTGNEERGSITDGIANEFAELVCGKLGDSLKRIEQTMNTFVKLPRRFDVTDAREGAKFEQHYESRKERIVDTILLVDTIQAV